MTDLPVAPCPSHAFHFPRSFPELSPCPSAGLSRRPGQESDVDVTVKNAGIVTRITQIIILYLHYCTRLHDITHPGA
jgi:hypothetical protein